MKVINFFGGPCIGKSQLAPYAHSQFKKNHFKCEYIQEYVKESIIDTKRFDLLKAQDYIFAKQNRRLSKYKIRGDMDFLFVDSPILLSYVYTPEDFPGQEHFKQFVVAQFHSYNNVNFIIKRDLSREYTRHGRIHDESEAIELDADIKNLLIKLNIPFKEVDVNCHIDEISVYMNQFGDA